MIEENIMVSLLSISIGFYAGFLEKFISVHLHIMCRPTDNGICNFSTRVVLFFRSHVELRAQPFDASDRFACMIHL